MGGATASPPLYGAAHPLMCWALLWTLALPPQPYTLTLALPPHLHPYTLTPAHPHPYTLTTVLSQRTLQSWTMLGAEQQTECYLACIAAGTAGG